MARSFVPLLAILFTASTLSTAGLAAPAPLDEAPPQLKDDEPPELARRRRRSRKPKPEEADAAPPSASDAPLNTRRGPARVDFDERVIKGQTNKANAIYLFQRRESRLRTLVKKRKHFHELIDETLE